MYRVWQLHNKTDVFVQQTGKTDKIFNTRLGDFKAEMRCYRQKQTWPSANYKNWSWCGKKAPTDMVRDDPWFTVWEIEKISMNRETKTNFDKRSKHRESLCQKSNINVIT